MLSADPHNVTISPVEIAATFALSNALLSLCRVIVVSVEDLKSSILGKESETRMLVINIESESSISVMPHAVGIERVAWRLLVIENSFSRS